MAKPKEGLLADWFTNVDNCRYELGRALWAVGSVAAIGFQGWALHKGQEFDPLAFTSGFAAMLAAGGFGIAQKDRAARAN